MKKRLIVIDGNALVHRAFHALPPLKTKKGELVNGVYKTIEGYFEEKKHTFLPYHKMCAEYLKRISSGQNITDAKRVIYRYPIEPNESLEEITLKFSKTYSNIKMESGKVSSKDR